jgi:type VI secretion system secreted protein VgrG
MPPYKLPDEKTKSTLKSNSSTGGGGFNEIRFEDKKGKEQIFIHAEKQRDLRVKADNFETIGNDEHLVVGKDRHKQIKGDEHFDITGSRNEKIGEALSIKIGTDLQEKVGSNAALDAGSDIHVKAGMNVVIEAGIMITLKASGSFITVGPSGVAISGSTVMINSGGSAGSGAGCSPTPPVAAKEADTAKAGSKGAAPQKRTYQAQPVTSPTATALKSAAQSGAPFCAV